MEETKKLDLNNEATPESFMKNVLGLNLNEQPKKEENPVAEAIAKSIEPEGVEEAKVEAKKEEDNLFDILGLNKEESTEKPATKTEEKENTQSVSKYREIYDLNVENGIWAPLENPDEIEWDNETYKEVVKLQSEKIAMSDDDKELLDIVKNIRDKDWASQQLANQSTIENIDVESDINTAISVLGHLMVDMEEMDKDKFEKYVSRLTDEEIIAEAQEAKDKLIEISKESLKLQADRDKEARDKADEERKKLEKQTKEELKKFKLSEVEVGRAVKTIFAVDKETNLADIDKKYLELRNNPEQAAFLYQMFYNRDNMMRNIESKAKTAIKLQEASNISKQADQRTTERPKLRLM